MLRCVEVDGPESSRASSTCIVMRLRRLGRVWVLGLALPRVGIEGVVLLARVSSGRERVGFADAADAVGDVVDPPAVLCERVMEVRFCADIVMCVSVCAPVLVLKSGVVEDDGAGVEASTSRRGRLLLVRAMFGEFVVYCFEGEEVRMSMGGLCSRARRCALFAAHANACEWTSGSESKPRESSHKAAFRSVIGTRKVNRGRFESCLARRPYALRRTAGGFCEYQ